MKYELTPRRKERRIMAVWTSLVLRTALFTTSAFAADSDPLTIVNNLSDFIFPASRPLELSSSAGALCSSVCLCNPTTRRRERRVFFACSVAY